MKSSADHIAAEDGIIRNQFNRPLCMIVADEGKEYLVAISDDAQMSQQVLKGYGKSVGIDNLPQVTCKTANKKTTIDANNQREVRNYVDEMKSKGKEHFVIPLISQNENGGDSGHTIYAVYTKDGANYKSTILTQTENVTAENQALYQEQAAVIGAAAGLSMNGHPTRIIAGAFPPQENSASCTEIGAPLLRAMMDEKDPLTALNQAMDSSQTTTLTLKEVAEIRLQGMKHSSESRSIEASIQDPLNLAPTVIEHLNSKSASDLATGKPLSPVSLLAISLGCDRSAAAADVKRNGISANITAIPIEGREGYQQATSYLKRCLETDENGTKIIDAKLSIPPYRSHITSMMESERQEVTSKPKKSSVELAASTSENQVFDEQSTKDLASRIKRSPPAFKTALETFIATSKEAIPEEKREHWSQLERSFEKIPAAKRLLDDMSSQGFGYNNPENVERLYNHAIASVTPTKRNPVKEEPVILISTKAAEPQVDPRTTMQQTISFIRQKFEEEAIEVPIKSLALQISKEAAPEFKQALAELAKAPEAEIKKSWDAMAEKYKDNPLLKEMTSQGFDYRNPDSIEKLNKHVVSYSKETHTRAAEEEIARVSKNQDIIMSSTKKKSQYEATTIGSPTVLKIPRRGNSGIAVY